MVWVAFGLRVSCREKLNSSRRKHNGNEEESCKEDRQEKALSREPSTRVGLLKRVRGLPVKRRPFLFAHTAIQIVCFLSHFALVYCCPAISRLKSHVPLVGCGGSAGGVSLCG